MTPTASYQNFLETFACAHVNDGFLDDNGERMLGNFMRFQGSSLTKVKELKERGNDLFRRNYFDLAAACYDEACKLLGLSFGDDGDEDFRSLSELAVSLNSNLAACALKLEEFQATLDLCSMILNFFPQNVKALFRRALAIMKLKRFLEAEKDLVEALVVEPKNKDVLRELGVVKSELLMKQNGKRMLEVDSALEVDSNKKLVHVSEASVRVKDSENVKLEVSNAQNNHGLGMENGIKVNERVVVEIKDDKNNCGMDLCTNSTKDEHIAGQSPIHEFSKKGGGNFRLRIREQTYQKLLEGKKLSFYHKRDLSTLTIRILYKEKTKETDTTRDKGKKNRRRRRSRKRTIVTMNEDLSDINNAKPLVPDASSETSSICDNFSTDSCDINNAKPFVPDASSNTSSICDNFSSAGTQSLQLPNTVTSHDSSLPFFTSFDGANSVRSQAQAHYDSNVHPPFFFSACPKKCKTYSSSVRKLSSAPRTSRTSKLCRYPLTRNGKIKRRILTFKKTFSQGVESPRHNLSTFSASRSLTHKFLRPRGVSVSCCRYYSEAPLIRKRKEMFAQLTNSDRPLKKPTLIITPILSLVSFSNNVIIKSDSESRI